MRKSGAGGEGYILLRGAESGVGEGASYVLVGGLESGGWRQCEWTVKWVQTSGEDGKVGEQAFKTDKHITPSPGSHTPVNLKTQIILF